MLGRKKEKCDPYAFTLVFYPPVDLYLNFEKSILKNQVRRTGFLVYSELPVLPAKIIFDFCRLKIQFIELNFPNLIFQNSSTDQQGDTHIVGLFYKLHGV